MSNSNSRSRSRSLTSSTNDAHNDRLEPRLLKACASDSLKEVRDVVVTARETGQLTDGFLRLGLLRACERGGIECVRYLLEVGALPDYSYNTITNANANANVQGNGNKVGGGGNAGRVTSSPLLKAVERNHVRVVQILLDYGASPDSADRKGRTALMTAAWRNHFHILQVLIARGADVNATDNRGRNVLHNLAADKTCDWGEDVVSLLLGTVCAVDAVDELGRTPLHWACATGKERLAEMLLVRPLHVSGNRRATGGRVSGLVMTGADVNAVEGRNKTALHLAVAHGYERIVALLLRHGADINARSDGGWTPLHNACDRGSESVARRLLAAGAKINAQLLNGISPLHLAAQGGHREVVECLLERSDLKQRLRDNFGSTAFLRAAQFKRKDIVALLAPYNNVEALSEDARGACEGFEATVVDFGNFHNENRVKRTSVFNLLYGRDPENPRKQAFNAMPVNSKATEFRWIHLPANNMAWVEALLTKAFIEEGAHDVDSFKGLERSFNYQHRGQKMHSNFMRPLCQSTHRAPKVRDDGHRDPVEEREEVQSPKILINGLSRELPSSPVPPSPKLDGNKKKQKPGGKMERVDSQDDTQSTSGKKGKKGSAGTPKGPKSPPIRREKSPHPTLCKEKPPPLESNICYFMPYLHFETAERRERMQEAIRKAQQARTPQPGLDRTPTRDELLLRAHLTGSSTSLHIRRTLDQFFYPNIDTQSRDQDQVVYRYQKKRSRVPEPKIFMVDQLWMWILGPSLIVTSFPQRWDQPKNDPLNVLDGIIEDINSKTREPVRSVYDLAIIITNRCSGVFDRHRMGDDEYQFLDMFESSIGIATDRESFLFNQFNRASAQASDWLKTHRKPSRIARRKEKDVAKDLNKEERKKQDSDEADDEPLFVDNLLDIGQETDLLAEAKDIRDELNMIRMVLHYQKNVLDDFHEVVGEIYLSQGQSQRDIKKRFGEQQRTIDIHLKDIDRMDKQAERIYSSITDLLDLKQKHANAFEARFARDQAAGTARQGKILMVFTMVTIVFLPLSFITSVFTINMPEFEDKLTMGYVAKYTFGIGFGISIPLVLLALVLDDIGDIFQEGLRRARGWVRAGRYSKNQLLLDRMKAQRQSRERTLLPTRERTKEREKEVLELEFDKTV
jgi:ankyrin repeat protein/Mg2+ and Co2+ transporter CorA